MSSPLSCTPYSSSTIWASSTKSSESMSSDSKVASGLIWSGSAPNSSSAENTRLSISSRVAVAAISFSISLSLSGREAPVDGQAHAGHVRGALGRQEAHALGHLIRRAGSLRRHVLQQVVCDALGHFGLDRAGGHRVHGHSATGHLRGDGPRHRDETRLRGSVV